MDYYGKFLKTAKLRLNQVQSEIDFQEVSGKLIFLKGFANPFDLPIKPIAQPIELPGYPIGVAGFYISSMCSY